MYVIWRKRKREHYAGWGEVGDVRLTPIIAQSRRVNGGPRQEHIACLPSIIESEIDEKNGVWFWDAVEEKLARLANRIPSEEAAKIRAALCKVVQRAALDDRRDVQEMRERIYILWLSLLWSLPDMRAGSLCEPIHTTAPHVLFNTLRTGPLPQGPQNWLSSP